MCPPTGSLFCPRNIVWPKYLERIPPKVTKEAVTSNTVGEVLEVLISVLGDDDVSDDFGLLECEVEEEEDERVSAYTGQQQFGLEKLAALSQVVSTEPLANSSRICSGPEEQFLDSAGAFEQPKDFNGK